MTRLDAITGASLPGGPADLILNGDRVGRAAPPGTVDILAVSGSAAHRVSADFSASGGPAKAGPAVPHTVGPDTAVPDTAVLDAAGRVVLPAFVDAHVHLDKAFLLDPIARELAAEGAEPTADLNDAIATVARLRPRLGPDVVRAGAQRAVDTLVRNGTLAARAMVELDPAVGLDLMDLHADLAARNAGRIDLQLTAFPQRGLELPGNRELLKGAMASGADVVGGCPYVDTDPAAHLDVVFDLAQAHGAPVDLHLDFGDDPDASLIGLVVERTRAAGMQGRVAIGHVTTLAAMDPDTADRAFDALADAGIALAVMPATDLYLAGHARDASAGHATRPVAPILRAARAGVTVAITNNNLCNPFAPYGNGSQLQAAWLAGLLFRAATAADRAVLIDAITANPARILGLPVHGPFPGAAADLVVLDAPTADEAVLQSAPVAAVIRAGVLLDRTR
ncbi:amidohydrolase family protein [Glycomyces endophyticus]|uniref:Amidohydrolase family protein n=1 Tax=Glycomyces endophyticus TaxID=480996 RepID=A0ABP4TBU8_9ACTN